MFAELHHLLQPVEHRSIWIWILQVVDDDFLNDYYVYDVDGNMWTVWTNFNAPNYM